MLGVLNCSTRESVSPVSASARDCFTSVIVSSCPAWRRYASSYINWLTTP